MRRHFPTPRGFHSRAFWLETYADGSEVSRVFLGDELR
jgi:hypothetical protein